MIRVLLADDQPLLRMGLRIVIDNEPDLQVVGEAGDGAEAIALTASEQPDVVLMDIRMPGTDGITATAHITAAHPDSRVIILTTFDIDHYVFDGIQAGASGFLLKDAGPESLLDAIRTVARGDAVLAPVATRQLITRFTQHTPTPSVTRAKDSGVDQLTEREHDVFLLIARGLSNREIADELVVSENTVKIHVGRILTKLNLRDRVQAVVLAYQTGIASIDGQ